jgi:hypothetical protein
MAALLNIQQIVQIVGQKRYPVQFDSTWIQSATDAKSVADWITSTQLNKGQKRRNGSFGNPLINAWRYRGINYQSLDLSTTNEKYIVTSVRLGFSQGVTTNIICRAI